jgi:hypothetical protein
MIVTTKRCRPRRFGCYSGAALLLALCGWPLSLHAQRTRLTPAAIGQIVDEVLSELVSPDTLASRIPIGKRGVYFDRVRSMRAFGYADSNSIATAELHLHNPVREGSLSLLEDCRGRGMRPCRQIGWGVYVAVEPIAVTDSGAIVNAVIRWADRGPELFKPGVAPTGPSVLVGFTSQVELIRTSTGRWKFAKLGRTRVSD